MPTRTSVSMLDEPVIRPMPTGARSRSILEFVAVENKFVVQVFCRSSFFCCCNMRTFLFIAPHAHRTQKCHNNWFYFTFIYNKLSKCFYFYLSLFVALKFSLENAMEVQVRLFLVLDYANCCCIVIEVALLTDRHSWSSAREIFCTAFKLSLENALQLLVR